MSSSNPESVRSVPSGVRAVTFDFYDTLGTHRHGVGRGGLYREFLAREDLEADPWEHDVTYDLFRFYADEYGTGFSEAEELAFWTEFTRRLFERTKVRGVSASDCREHAFEIRDIFGARGFILFDDTAPVLRELKGRGFPVGVVSNWPRGLGYFLEEFGIRSLVETVVVSDEVGIEKPDPRIFQIAIERLGVPASSILHVGDKVADDVEGSLAVGMRPVLISRDGDVEETRAPVVSDLSEVLDLVPQSPGEVQ